MHIMNKEKEFDLYKTFPSILKCKIDNKEIELPLGTNFNYEPILAFRLVIRDIDDYSPIEKRDMLSYFEMNKKPRSEFDINDPEYYSVSFFKNKECLKESFKLPKPKKKIVKGYVHQEGGPEYTKNNHISWWLCADIGFDDFSFLKDD